MLDKKGFDLWAKEYDSTVNTCYVNKEYPFDGYYDVLDYILKKIRPASKVLDVGFGTGILTQKVYDMHCAIFGIDFSSEMVAISKTKMPRGKFYECDFNDALPHEIASETYDYIISTYAIHHLTDDKKMTFIASLIQLLNSGGKIILGDIAFATEQEQIDCKKTAKGFDEEELYIVAEAFIKKLKSNKIEAEFIKMSSCAGILCIEKED